MRCEKCSRYEPTAYVELRHNIGMLVVRQERGTAARLCGRCLGRAFAYHQACNLTVGWWGYISFVMTWVFLFKNTHAFFAAREELGARRAKAAPTVVHLSGTDARRVLLPFEHNVRLRLRTDDAPADIARDLARDHGVTLASATQFVEALEREEARASSAA